MTKFERGDRALYKGEEVSVLSHMYEDVYHVSNLNMPYLGDINALVKEENLVKIGEKGVDTET